jgi:hypothetical protein
LHPKETRERVAQNPNSNPTYTVDPKETRKKAGTTYKFTGTLIVDRKITKPATLRKVPPELHTIWEKTSHSRTALRGSEQVLRSREYVTR